MLAFILALYCCIWCKACYIVRNKRGREPLSEKKKKREVAKGQEKNKRKEKNNKAEGLSKKERKKSTKCLCMPKAFELKEKLREAQNA